ncbi:757_t:CDS:2, partial [Gigaspora rosea]
VKILEERGADFNTYEKLEEYAQDQEVRPCYHGAKSNNLELSKVAITDLTYLYESLKSILTKELKISDDEYDKLVNASKNELFEFDSYYNIVRVYARKINNNANE